jgi:sugar/nucleoside kinase (ribokinase family)
MKKVICVGSVSQDIFFPLDGIRILDTPEDVTAQKNMVVELGAKYQTEDRYESAGGCAANVSVGLAKLGADAACYGVVGRDAFGESLLELLREGRVDCSLISVRDANKTDLSCILVDVSSGERTIVYNRDANEHLEVASAALHSASAIFVSGLYGSWKENMNAILSCVETHSAILFYNPGQKNIKDDAEKVIACIRMSFGLFVNKDEAIDIVLHAFPHEEKSEYLDEIFLLKKLRSIGPVFVSLTDGERGAWTFDGGTVLYVKPDRVNHVVDSTGAGDAYASAFIAGYVQQKNLDECMRWGIANSRSVIQYYGAQQGLLSMPEIQKFSQEVKIQLI